MASLTENNVAMGDSDKQNVYSYLESDTLVSSKKRLNSSLSNGYFRPNIWFFKADKERQIGNSKQGTVKQIC